MKATSRTLNILMNGILVGHLAKKSNGVLSFTYDQQWLITPQSRPISLSLPLINQPYEGDIVYNFFDNLLPDNPLIRNRIQAKFQIASNQPFDLLAGIGRDCVGAIQIIEGEITPLNKQINAQPLNDKEIAEILRNYKINPLGMTDDNQAFRISIAGAQEKSAFLFHRNKWNKPIGETPTSHIFKLPIGYIQHQHLDLSESCENEWLCTQIAKAFGLPAADCEILMFEDIKVLVIKRFDRKLSSNNKWLMRLPQEDMCQALGFSSNIKYQADGGPGINQIMRLLLSSATPTEDRDLFFKSQVLFWLLAAIDGHAKNFSIFIEPEGKYRLTPLYDIMSAYPLLAKKQLQAQKIKMAMALKGKNNHYHWDKLQRRYFIETAKAANYSSERAEVIIEEMLGKVELVVEKVADNLPPKFPSQIAKSIFAGMLFVKRNLMM